MVIYVQNALYILAVLFMLASIYFSFKQRRADSPQKQGFIASKMNISMGIMLILLGSIQLFLNTKSWVHFTVGIVFVLLGLFNLFAGLRNYGLYRRNQN